MNSENDHVQTAAGEPVSPSGDIQEREKQEGWFRRSFSPFRIATLRGLAIVLPPILTVIFFVWAWNTIDNALFKPVENLASYLVISAIDETKSDADVQEIVRQSADPEARFRDVDGQRLFLDDSGVEYAKVQLHWIPNSIFTAVNAKPGRVPPVTAENYYSRYVQIRYLKRHLLIPAFLALFLAIMYLVGKLLAAGIGRFFYHLIENMIHQVPIIRNVYSSVKQVTDFVFRGHDVQFTRVVAVEYPRKGIWSIGFVTSEGMYDIMRASNEPMLTVLMPTSPMPATGFTITVPKRETIELNITMDQAIQFCVSCGVVIPHSQLTKSALEAQVQRKLTGDDSQVSDSQISDSQANDSEDSDPDDNS